MLFQHPVGGLEIAAVADNLIAWKDSGPHDIGGATASGIDRLRILRPASADLTKATPKRP